VALAETGVPLLSAPLAVNVCGPMLRPVICALTPSPHEMAAPSRVQSGSFIMVPPAPAAGVMKKVASAVVGLVSMMVSVTGSGATAAVRASHENGPASSELP